MPRRLLVEHIRTLFSEAKHSPYWERVKKLPIILRYIIGIGLTFFGVLGMFTPIPAGVVFFVLGIALIVGIRRARSWTIAFVHLTRLHILYGKVYIWWQLRNR